MTVLATAADTVRLINTVAGVVLLIAAVLPIAMLPLWRSPVLRRWLLVVCWVDRHRAGRDRCPDGLRGAVRDRRYRYGDRPLRRWPAAAASDHNSDMRVSAGACQPGGGVEATGERLQDGTASLAAHAE
jgi:hypothetical protein